MKCFQPFGAGVRVDLDDAGVPTRIAGPIATRKHPQDPAKDAREAVKGIGAAFRVGPDDDFVAEATDARPDGAGAVRLVQTYKGIPVAGGELVVEMNEDGVTGIRGRFISGLVVDIEAGLSTTELADRALGAARDRGYRNPCVTATGRQAIVTDAEGIGHLTLAVRIAEHDSTGVSQEFQVDVVTGRVATANRTPQIIVLGQPKNALQNPTLGYEPLGLYPPCTRGRGWRRFAGGRAGASRIWVRSGGRTLIA